MHAHAKFAIPNMAPTALWTIAAAMLSVAAPAKDTTQTYDATLMRKADRRWPWPPNEGPKSVGTPGGGLAWTNPPPPDNATSPYDGAVYMYDRTEGELRIDAVPISMLFVCTVQAEKTAVCCVCPRPL